MPVGLAKQLAKPLAMPAAVLGFVNPVSRFVGSMPAAVSAAKQAILVGSPVKPAAEQVVTFVVPQ